jgi:ketosteroid isomerase-like protein
MKREPDLDTMLSQVRDDDLGVQSFLNAFGKALTTGDADAIAQMWETPAFVLGADVARTVSNREEVAELFEGARADYNAMGIVDTKPQIIRLDEVSDHMVMVRVRGPYLDAQGMERGAETSTYTLTRAGDGDWKFRVTVMHGAEAMN